MAKRKEFRETLKPSPKSSSACDEIMVIGPGDRSYVWIGRDGVCVAHFSGPALLKKLASAITKSLKSK